MVARDLTRHWAVGPANMAVSVCSDAQRVVMTPTAGGGGIGGANLVSESISINIYVRTLHGRKASNASQASNASSRIKNLHIRRAKVCTQDMLKSAHKTC